MTNTVSLMMPNNDIATLVVHVLFPRDGPRGGRAAEEGEGHGGGSAGAAALVLKGHIIVSPGPKVNEAPILCYTSLQHYL